MQRKRFFYLIKLQYLGYRLHGWQRQPGIKTVEGLLKKTLKFILPDRKFKILGSSRTDAMVSANLAAFELFLDEEPLSDKEEFMRLFNFNLPPDIKVLEIDEVDAKFNIIQHPKQKEYCYLFSYGEKNHPFCAPLMANFQHDLDIELMQKAAKIFQGTHYFKNYCAAPTEKTIFEREVLLSEIEVNTMLTANFFPKTSYVFTIKGAGFLRYQIRLMMGSLIQVGKGDLTLQQLKESLSPNNNIITNYIAPASGLILHKIDFE